MYESTKRAVKKYKLKHKTITLLISKIFFDRIKKQADADDISVSELLRRGAELYLEKRAPEMAQERAQKKAEQEAKREARAKAKAEKERQAQEEWQKQHGYNPESDAPKIKTSHTDVVMPEPLEPIDYRQRLAEAEASRQQVYLTAEQQKAEADRERVEQEAAQRAAFEAAKQILKQQAEQEQKPKKKYNRDGYPIEEKEPEPVQEQEQEQDLSDLRSVAVRPIDQQKKVEIPKELLDLDLYGDIRKMYPDDTDYLKALERKRDASRARRYSIKPHK